MKRTLDSVDLAKFIGSILVFTMHCNALEEYGALSFVPQMLARWAVPFFFLCSAFFLFGKAPDGRIGRETVYAYIRRIGLLYAVWFVFNLPSTFFIRLSGRDLSAAATWLHFLKETLISSTFTGSWFLTSSMFGAWFVYVLGRRVKTGAVLGISFVFYVLCALCSAYLGLLPRRWASALLSLNFPCNLATGCFYFALGKSFAENRTAILRHMTKRRAAVCFAGSYLAFVAEIWLSRRLGYYGGTDAAFSTAAMAVFLFLLCLQSDLRLKNGRLLRKCSIIIYCSQSMLLHVLGLFRRMLNALLPAYLLTLAAVAGLCALILYLQKNKRWKWLAYLT